MPVTSRLSLCVGIYSISGGAYCHMWYLVDLLLAFQGQQTAVSWSSCNHKDTDCTGDEILALIENALYWQVWSAECKSEPFSCYTRLDSVLQWCNSITNTAKQHKLMKHNRTRCIYQSINRMRMYLVPRVLIIHFFENTSSSLSALSLTASGPTWRWWWWAPTA